MSIQDVREAAMKKAWRPDADQEGHCDHSKIGHQRVCNHCTDFWYEYAMGLEKELEKTNELINKVENVMIELINAELDVHEERLKYYQVQSHLAKVRILDSTLSDLDGPAEDAERDKPESRQSPTASGGKKPGSAGDDDAAA